jgi:hypothetical protein
MDNKVSGIERAFQLAKSGLVRDIDELRVVLKKEAKARNRTDPQETTTRAHWSRAGGH